MPAPTNAAQRIKHSNSAMSGDGAGLCIMTTRAHAEKEGMPVLGKYVTSTVVGALWVCAAGGAG